jgi:hypothetical protein
VELVEWKENILINGNEKVDNRADRQTNELTEMKRKERKGKPVEGSADK